MKRIYECGKGEYLIGKLYDLNWEISKGVGEPGSHVNNTILMQIYDSWNIRLKFQPFFQD